MIRYAAALLLLFFATPTLAVPSQLTDDLAQREAAVRRVFIPGFEAGMRPAVEASWSHFPTEHLDPEELAAARKAFAREVDASIVSYGDRIVAIIAKRVPLEQITETADVQSPAWRAALGEIEQLVQESTTREGVELVLRVIDESCRVKTRPSEACSAMLEMVADYREGRLTLDDIMKD